MARETKIEVSSSILKALLTENFIKVFARSLSIQNGVLFEAARSLKTSVIKMLDQVEVPADHATQLLQTFFGPNTSTKLAVKRNQDLLKALASKMDSENVAAYLTAMQSQFNSPLPQEHFGDDKAIELHDHMIEQIRQFSMSQIASAPSVFRHCLESSHISQCLTTLIPVAFGSQLKESLRVQAQFKLFNLVEMLQKIKLGSGPASKKGFVEGSDKLWLSVANAKIHNLIKESEEMATIAKQQKGILKFVKTTVTPLRQQLTSQAAEESVLEKKVKIEVDAKRALAIEKLILSLSLTMCLPGVDMRDLTDTFEQIEDLMECFKQLGLGKVESGKKAKKEKSGNESQTKAFSVLFDLLIA